MRNRTVSAVRKGAPMAIQAASGGIFYLFCRERSKNAKSQQQAVAYSPLENTQNIVDSFSRACHFLLLLKLGMLHKQERKLLVRL